MEVPLEAGLLAPVAADRPASADSLQPLTSPSPPSLSHLPTPKVQNWGGMLPIFPI